MLHEVLGLVTSIDPSRTRTSARRIFDHLTEEVLLAALADCEELMRDRRTADTSSFWPIATGTLRQFAPAFLAAFDFRSHQPRGSSSCGGRRAPRAERQRWKAVAGVPEDAPVELRALERWRPYVVGDDGRIERRWLRAVCVVGSFGSALRVPATCGSLGSRRYADPESYLIPKERWPSMRV